jgi:hypothetical protein
MSRERQRPNVDELNGLDAGLPAARACSIITT